MSDRPSRDPSTDTPLNPPDVPVEEKMRQLAGEQPVDDQSAVLDADQIDTLGEFTPTALDEGELEAGVSDDLPDEEDVDTLDMLTELELRDGETSDVTEAVEEGMTYVPPIDPPVVPSDTYDGAEVASGFGESALAEPYDEDHASDFMYSDDEMVGLVRDAIRADSATSQFAKRLHISARDKVVTLRGEVDDLTDSDNLLDVAGRVEGVEDVIDELRVRGLE